MFPLKSCIKTAALGTFHSPQFNIEVDRKVTWTMDISQNELTSVLNTKKGCLAIIFALCKFDVYVDGTTFVVKTDHQALTWLLRLSHVIHYHSMKTNATADMLT